MPGGRMKRYIIKRIIWLVPIMLVISFITFSLMYLSPGDPVLIYLSQGGDAPNMEAAAELREKLGLNAPFLVQYGRWIVNALHGELGTSIFTGNPVAQEIATYFPNTLKLTFLAVFLTLLVSVPLGIIAAVFENRIIDYIIRFFAFINGSMPGFFAAMLMIYVVGVRLRLLPTVSSGNAKGIWMPALTLTLCLSAGYIRQVRIAIIQELGEDYVRLKRARGIRERTILFRGALKSALPSVFTIAGINIGRLLGGTAIIETVCTYQGIGRLAIQSITNRDYPLMQGYVLVMAGIYVLANLIVDLLHAAVDPRVRNRFIQESMKGAGNGKRR